MSLKIYIIIFLHSIFLINADYVCMTPLKDSCPCGKISDLNLTLTTSTLNAIINFPNIQDVQFASPQHVIIDSSNDINIATLPGINIINNPHVIVDSMPSISISNVPHVIIDSAPNPQQHVIIDSAPGLTITSAPPIVISNIPHVIVDSTPVQHVIIDSSTSLNINSIPNVMIGNTPHVIIDSAPNPVQHVIVDSSVGITISNVPHVIVDNNPTQHVIIDGSVGLAINSLPSINIGNTPHVIIDSLPNPVHHTVIDSSSTIPTQVINWPNQQHVIIDSSSNLNIGSLPAISISNVPHVIVDSLPGVSVHTTIDNTKIVTVEETSPYVGSVGDPDSGNSCKLGQIIFETGNALESSYSYPASIKTGKSIQVGGGTGWNSGDKHIRSPLKLTLLNDCCMKITGTACLSCTAKRVRIYDETLLKSYYFDFTFQSYLFIPKGTHYMEFLIYADVNVENLFNSLPLLECK